MGGFHQHLPLTFTREQNEKLFLANGIWKTVKKFASQIQFPVHNNKANNVEEIEWHFLC